MDVGRPERSTEEDRSGSARGLIRERLRVAAGVTTVGFLVGAIVGGVGGRVAMRILAITSDDRLKGMLTDDEAKVNQFTFGGTMFLVIFLGFGGIVLAFLYLAARRSMPAHLGARATIFAVLFWGIQGSGVFEPEGFDFRRLSPRWLAVAMFTAIFLGVGALVARGVERAVDDWPRAVPALLPLLLLLVIFPIGVVAIVATALASAVDRWRPLRIAGSFAVAAPFAIWCGPTAANVVRILV
jgi:hypothetical protein